MTLAAILVVGLVNAAAPARAAPAEMIAYETHRGDTLDRLGTRYLVRPQAYRAVQRLNKIRDPRRLRVGSVLQIPLSLLKTEPVLARVEAFSGIVTTGSGSDVRQVTTATQIAAGTTIASGANSFVTVVFPDETRMTLPSLSLVRVVRSNRILLTGAVDRQIRVESGRSHYSVTPRTNNRDRFEVHTPLAIAAVRGTEFRVGYEAGAGRSAIEVLEGEVAGNAETVASLAAEAPADVTVTANNAALFRADTAAPQMLALPPAPALLHPGRLQDDDDVVFEFATAGTHRLQLARDASFIDLFAETRSDSPQVPLAGVPNGTLFVRATAIDANDIEGTPVVYGFERQRNSVEAGVAPPQPGLRHRYLFKWRGNADSARTYRFVLARDRELSDRIVDEPGLTTNEIALANLAPGTYFWRLEATQFVAGKANTKLLKTNELRIASED